ncbi:MAG: L,D-transpeptidase, partial [Planctomycetota bacterium]
GLQALAADNLLEARKLLSMAVLGGQLDPDRDADARAKAKDLADRTILSSRVFADDPYTYRYAVQPRDMLIQVERREELKIPTQLIERINRVRADRIQAGQSLKLVRGPFHAIVSKRTMTMDVYLYRPNLPPVYIRRLDVGLGRDNGTPPGLWRVHSKDEKPIWYPPPGSSRTRPVSYGEPGYPFGDMGLWIRLEGLDESNEGLTRYGIHSTDDPSSIGRSESLGCIRLGDEDIDMIYGTLYQTWSTVIVTDY